jgi:hypothetical protein
VNLSELIRKMAEAGANAEVIALAVEAIEQRDVKESERKAKRAAQKAKERDNKATVARHSSDIDATVADLSLETPPPFPPKDNIKPPYTPNPVKILREAVCETTAQDLVAHRKAKKSPLTAGAAKGLVRAFLAFGDPEAAAAAMMAQGWTGFKPEWMAATTSRAGPAKAGNPQEIKNPYLRAAQKLDQEYAEQERRRAGFPPSESRFAEPESGPFAGGRGPILDLAAYR